VKFYERIFDFRTMHADHRSETGIDAQMLDLVVNPVDPDKRRYRVSENEGQIENGYKTLKFMVFDHELDISVIYTSERFM